MPLKSSLRTFFIRIVQIETVLVLAHAAAAVATHILYWRDPCNFASCTECTTSIARDRLGWFGSAAVIGFLLAHASAVGVGVYAMKKRRQTEPLLLKDTLLVVVGMPAAIFVFWLGLRPTVPRVLGAIDGAATFVENVRR